MGQILINSSKTVSQSVAISTSCCQVIDPTGGDSSSSVLTPLQASKYPATELS
jgi:hypothetical protein